MFSGEDAMPNLVTYKLDIYRNEETNNSGFILVLFPWLLLTHGDESCHQLNSTILVKRQDNKFSTGTPYSIYLTGNVVNYGPGFLDEAKCQEY